MTLENILLKYNADIRLVKSQAATLIKIKFVQYELDNIFPEELEAFLLESNGLDEYMNVNGEILHIANLIWNVDKILQYNRDFRNDESIKNTYMPIDCLLFIGDINGSPFGYAVINKEAKNRHIYIWDKIDDSRTWIASDILEVIKGYLQNTIRY